MQNNANSQKLQILFARKTEIDKLLNFNEHIVDDTHLIVSLIKTQNIFSTIANNLNNAEILNQPISALDFEQSSALIQFESDACMQTSTFPTILNYITLKFEHLFSDSSIFEIDELLDLCSITDLNNDIQHGQTQEELKEILWKIRCAISHNKEALKNQGHYSAVNLTDDASILIDVSLKKHGSVILKTKLHKLHHFLSQIDKLKELKKDNILSQAKPYTYEDSDEETAKKIMGNKGLVLKIHYDKTSDYYFDINSEFVQSIINELFKKTNPPIDQEKCKQNIERRLKLLKTYYKQYNPEYLEPEYAQYLMLDIVNHLLKNSYISTMLNTTLYMHELLYYWDYEKSIDDNLAFFVQNGRENEEVERELFVLYNLYPAAVLNSAKFMFTNHQKELSDFLETEKQGKSKILKNLAYKKGDLALHLRNSIHHGRFLLQYPNKTDFKQEDAFVTLFDGDGPSHDFFMSMRIRDLASLTEAFGVYLLNEHLNNASNISTSTGLDSNNLLNN